MHDAEQYAYENFNDCVDHILNDVEFANTNIPEGHMYKAWTAQEMLDRSAAGEQIEDSGDWS